MKPPEKREVTRALMATRAGNLADALTSVRRLSAFDARGQWSARREREAIRSQLRLPIDDTPHTGQVLRGRTGSAGICEPSAGVPPNHRMFPR